MKTIYTIELEYGSDFQKDFLDKTMEELLNSFKKWLENYHKKNKMTWKKDN